MCDLSRSWGRRRRSRHGSTQVLRAPPPRAPPPPTTPSSRFSTTRLRSRSRRPCDLQRRPRCEPVIAPGGVIPSWVRDGANAERNCERTFHARAETVYEKPAFRAAIGAKRNPVPGDGFFEWCAEKMCACTASKRIGELRSDAHVPEVLEPCEYPELRFVQRTLELS